VRLALTLGYSGARMTHDMDLVREVERLGYDSIMGARGRNFYNDIACRYGDEEAVAGDRLAARTMAELAL
jgi:hypothetical protein